jgi:hypothetical protein
MSRLMLDYFRRWCWVLALLGLLEFKLGWSIANRPADPFEWWAFVLTLYAGALLLGFDLRRGALRPVAVLPLTARQVGRSWWLATVPIPAAGSAALLFLGAGIFCHFHPNHFFPAEQLAMASLFTAVWLGMGFTLIFNATRGLGGSLWESSSNVLINAVSILMLFGSMLLCQDASKSPLRSAIVLGVGGLLTVVGYVRAAQFEPGRAWLYLGRAGQPDLGALGHSPAGRPGSRLTPLELRVSAGHYVVPAGYGGAALLLSTSFFRMFLYVGSMLALMALLSLNQRQPLPPSAALRVSAATGSFLACGFILVFQLLPVLRQLRFLRTLPVSPTRLAAVLFAIMLLPLVAVGALAAAVAWVATGTSAALTFLNCYTFILAPASLCVFLALWRGESVLTDAFLLLALFGFLKLYGELQLHLHALEVPFRLVAPLATGTVLAAFLFTYLALRHSSHAYRVRANPLGSFPWGAGR